MPNPPKPAKPAKARSDSVELRKFVGLKNVVDRERLGPDELEIAINVDLDDVGQLHRRAGRRLVAAGAWSSLIQSVNGRLYGVLNGSLVRIYPNFNTAVLQSGFNSPLASTQVDDKIYFSSRSNSGVIDTTQDTVSPWKGPALGPATIADPLDPRAFIPALPEGGWWHSPVVNPSPTLPPIKGKILGPPPNAEFLAYFHGRIFLGQGKAVWHTELFNYSYVNRTKNFFQFEAEITMIGSVTDGIYVGTKEGLWFLSLATRIEGHPAGAFKRVRVMDSAVLPGSMVYIPGELANPEQVGLNQDTPLKVSVLFMTTAGYCIGQDGGQAVNFSEDRFIFPDASSASAMYRFQKGMHQYVAVLNSGGSPSTNARIGDHVDATLRKAGTWQENSDCMRLTESLSMTFLRHPATFNPADKTTSITLSAGNLIATSNAPGTDAQVRSFTSHATGKWHVEATSLVSDGLGENAFGFARDNASHTIDGLGTGPYVGSDLFSAGLWDNFFSDLYIDTTPVQELTDGWRLTTVAMEIDLDAQLVSFKNVGGVWSPPFHFSAMASGVPYFVILDLSTEANSVSVNFGGSAFAVTPQAGFLPWG